MAKSIKKQIKQLEDNCPSGYYMDNVKVNLFDGEPQVTCDYKRLFVYRVYETDWAPDYGAEKPSLFSEFNAHFGYPNDTLEDGTPRFEIVKIWSRMKNDGYEAGYILYREYFPF